VNYPAEPLDEELESKPSPRQEPNAHCLYCPDREVIPDGHGEFIHADDYRYSCTPGEVTTTFAYPAIMKIRRHS